MTTDPIRSMTQVCSKARPAVPVAPGLMLGVPALVTVRAPLLDPLVARRSVHHWSHRGDRRRRRRRRHLVIEWGWRAVSQRHHPQAGDGVLRGEAQRQREQDRAESVRGLVAGGRRHAGQDDPHHEQRAPQQQGHLRPAPPQPSVLLAPDLDGAAAHQPQADREDGTDQDQAEVRARRPGRARRFPDAEIAHDQRCQHEHPGLDRRGLDLAPQDPDDRGRDEDDVGYRVHAHDVSRPCYDCGNHCVRTTVFARLPDVAKLRGGGARRVNPRVVIRVDCRQAAG